MCPSRARRVGGGAGRRGRPGGPPRRPQGPRGHNRLGAERRSPEHAMGAGRRTGLSAREREGERRHGFYEIACRFACMHFPCFPVASQAGLGRVAQHKMRHGAAASNRSPPCVLLARRRPAHGHAAGADTDVVWRIAADAYSFVTAGWICIEFAGNILSYVMLCIPRGIARCRVQGRVCVACHSVVVSLQKCRPTRRAAIFTDDGENGTLQPSSKIVGGRTDGRRPTSFPPIINDSRGSERASGKPRAHLARPRFCGLGRCRPSRGSHDGG